MSDDPAILRQQVRWSEPFLLAARDGKFFREPVSSLRAGAVVPGGKGKLTDGGTRVPLLVRWPGTTPAGRVTDQLVDFSDFLPTFAALAGKAVPEALSIDGKSFAESLRGHPVEGRRWAFAQQGKECWVRNQRWKLYRDGRLFGVREDPQETEAISETAGGEAARHARSELDGAMKALFPSDRAPGRKG